MPSATLVTTRAADHRAAEALNLPRENVRTRALHQTLHATVLADRGDLEAACHTAGQALTVAADLRSRRLTERLQEFERIIERYARVSVAVKYLEASHDLVGAQQ